MHQHTPDTAPAAADAEPAAAEGFYVSARYRDRARLLLGPYATHQEAKDNVARARRYVVEYDLLGWLYAYGTLRGEMKAGRPLPAGRLNDVLGLTEAG
ncbi:hypothetical protein ACGF3G_00640 [Streptomyces sp. NPDC048179]|uniref:hypothetical protein n=1 Tax=Streptomyces sp. NPDC048179 TaxID=3365506 RepID=UPI003710798A